MELLRTSCFGKPLVLEATMAGWQRLYWGGEIISERPAGYPTEGVFEHVWTFRGPDGDVECRLRFGLQWQPFLFRYELVTPELPEPQTGERQREDLERSTPQTEGPGKRKVGSLGLATLFFKLAKSAKVLKVLFGLASLAAYSWLFSLPFALCLIGCLVVHEFGHLRAMSYFGMKTRGIYLIPFMGGLAITEDRINTRWQGAFIALAGPTFGALLSVLAWLAWLFTDNPFFAGLAGFNALLNLFQILPVLPLDGGHVLKNVSFSMNSGIGLVMCIVGAVLGTFVSYQLGLELLGFLLAIGSFEILMEWKLRHYSPLLPMGSRARTFITAWYLVIVLVLIGVMLACAASGDELLGIPLLILQGGNATQT